MEHDYFDLWQGGQLGAPGQRAEADLDVRHWSADAAVVVKKFEEAEQDRIRYCPISMTYMYSQL